MAEIEVHNPPECAGCALLQTRICTDFNRTFCCSPNEKTPHCGGDPESICTDDFDLGEGFGPHYLLCPNADFCGDRNLVANQTLVNITQEREESSWFYCNYELKHSGESATGIKFQNSSADGVSLYLYKRTGKKSAISLGEISDKSYELTKHESLIIAALPFYIGDTSYSFSFNSFQSPNPDPKPDPSDQDSSKLLLIISISTGIALLLLIAIITLTCCIIRRKSRSGPSQDPQKYTHLVQDQTQETSA
ncbi:unnamed protein product [Moneuplotes crassus]|uniref:Uncharacterized protein n=1 Tax=Euplotes crassus TaxID=5936 RepID=A0AAD1XS46_EUPCR|nr:unnamed protein product [Moneuplotes crassus]